MTESSPWQRSGKEPWSCIILKFDEEANACSRAHQTKHEVWQSTTKCNTSMKREERSSLKISWSYCFQRRKEWLIWKRRTINISKLRRGIWKRVINKVKNSLTKKIWLHLHSSIEIISVYKLQENYLLSVGEGTTITRGELLAIAAWEEREEPLVNAAHRMINTYISKDYVITNDNLENYNDLIDPKKHIQNIRSILELVKQKSNAMCKIFPIILILWIY